MKGTSMKLTVILYIVFAIICITVGWVFRGLVDVTSVPKLQGVMAWGYEEKSNVWNRIRVDEKGNVMCHKEENDGIKE